MTSLRTAVDDLVAALVADPDVEQHRPVAVALLVSFAAHPAIVGYRYDATGTPTPLTPSAALTAATSALDQARSTQAGHGTDPEADGLPAQTPEEVAAVLVQVTPSETTIGLLDPAAAAQWAGEPADRWAELLRPETDEAAAAGPALPRATLDRVISTALASPEVEGLLLESVSLVLRRGAGPEVTWLAFAYPAGEEPRRWTPDLDPRTDVLPLFAATDDTPGDGRAEAEPVEVIVVQVHVHTGQAQVSLIARTDAPAWFPDEEDLDSLAHLAKPLPEHAAGPQPATGSVYRHDGNRSHLREDVVGELCAALWSESAAHARDAHAGDDGAGSEEPLAVSLVALRTDTGVEVAAFSYDVDYVIHPVLVPSLPIGALNRAFDEDPTLRCLLLRAVPRHEQAEVSLYRGPVEAQVWHTAAEDVAALGRLARPRTRTERAALDVLVDHVDADQLGPAAGLIAEAAAPGVVHVHPYAAWSAASGTGWTVTFTDSGPQVHTHGRQDPTAG